MKTRERTNIIKMSRMLSDIFRPTYFPMVGFAILLMFTYLSLLSWQWKVCMLLLVYTLTIVLPSVGIYVYRTVHKLTQHDLQFRHNRIVPYCLHLISYWVLLSILDVLRAPSFIGGIVVISLLVQLSCTIITLWWKISMHSAGVGAIIGALIAYSAIFQFNPVWWLCLAILVSGLVNSSRMYLRQHTLWQVLGGTLVGFVCGLVGLFI